MLSHPSRRKLSRSLTFHVCYSHYKLTFASTILQELFFKKSAVAKWAFSVLILLNLIFLISISSNYKFQNLNSVVLWYVSFSSRLWILFVFVLHGWIFYSQPLFLLHLCTAVTFICVFAFFGLSYQWLTVVWKY